MHMRVYTYTYIHKIYIYMHALYTQDTEGIYIKELPALRALFECYADGGGGGRADLMSLSEFDLLLTHTRIYDAEFTRRARLLAPRL